MQKSIEWFDTEGPATQERVDYVSKEIGITFPKNFIVLMKECDGGIPKINAFEYINVSMQLLRGAGIGCFMSFREKNYAHDHLLGHYKSENNYLPKEVIAFAFTGDGDYICFDYRKDKKTSDPEIVYWDHEESEGQNVSFVAKNFDAFMSMLHDDDEDED